MESVNYAVKLFQHDVETGKVNGVWDCPNFKTFISGFDLIVGVFPNALLAEMRAQCDVLIWGVRYSSKKSTFLGFYKYEPFWITGCTTRANDVTLFSKEHKMIFEVIFVDPMYKNKLRIPINRDVKSDAVQFLKPLVMGGKDADRKNTRFRIINYRKGHSISVIRLESRLYNSLWVSNKKRKRAQMQLISEKAKNEIILETVSMVEAMNYRKIVPAFLLKMQVHTAMKRVFVRRRDALRNAILVELRAVSGGLNPGEMVSRLNGSEFEELFNDLFEELQLEARIQCRMLKVGKGRDV